MFYAVTSMVAAGSIILTFAFGMEVIEHHLLPFWFVATWILARIVIAYFSTEKLKSMFRTGDLIKIGRWDFLWSNTMRLANLGMAVVVLSKLGRS